MIKDTISDSMINLILRQLGASSVKTKPAHVNTVKFDVGPDLRVTYLYEIKEGDGAYLQRVEPYPMMIGKLFNEEDILSIIKRDLNKFRLAYNSSNFNKFIDVAHNVRSLDKEIENLFLLRNVSAENLDIIDTAMNEVHEIIAKIASESEFLPEITKKY